MRARTNIFSGLAWLCIASWLLAHHPAAAQQTTRPLLADVGQFFPLLSHHAAPSTASQSYLARDWPDRELWRVQGRAKMHELLSYDPPASPLNAQILNEVHKDGYTRKLVRYSVAANRTTDAFLLIPDNLKKPAPAVIAIHDHGAFYYFGKEKITAIEHAPDILQRFIELSYGGQTFADELARRGFVVLVPDGFYFGSQRLDPNKVSERFTAQLRDLDPQSDEYIHGFNRFAGAHEALMAKTIFASGTTWPGILFQGDRASVNYLLTCDEVDPERIGCWVCQLAASAVPIWPDLIHASRRPSLPVG